MNAVQADTNLATFTALTEKLEQSPPCDIGRIGDPPPGIEPCPAPADYSCRVHQCGIPEGVLLLICEDHLASIVARIMDGLAKYPAGFLEQCGHPIRGVEDFVWSIAPLR